MKIIEPMIDRGTQRVLTLSTQNYSAPIHIFWTVWWWVSIGSFMAVEFTMLILGRPQDTLSAQVWRLLGVLPGASLSTWTAIHFLFIGTLILIEVWLIGHFGWGIWA